jgi:hypothetical protein
MYKHDFIEICETKKLVSIKCDDEGEGFKLFFEGVNVNVSLGEDYDENNEGDLVYWKIIKYETDEEKLEREKNSIKMFDSNGQITEEYNDFIKRNVQDLRIKYSSDSFTNWINNFSTVTDDK